MQNNDEYDNTNTGAIWKSKYNDNPKAPQYTGNLNVEGVDYKISAWKTSSDNPKAPVLNIKIQNADDQPVAATVSPSPIDEEDVPF